MKVLFSKCFKKTSASTRKLVVLAALAFALATGLIHPVLAQSTSSSGTSSTSNASSQSSSGLTAAQLSTLQTGQTTLNNDRQSVAGASQALSQAQSQAAGAQAAASSAQQAVTAAQSQMATDQAAGASATTLANDQAALDTAATNLSNAQNAMSSDQSSVGLDSAALANADGTLDDAEGTYTMTLGDVLCNVYDNISEFAEIYDLIAYTVGAFFIAYSIYGFAKHMEAPGSNPLHTQVIRLAGGAFMTALPEVVGTLVDSIFVGDSGSGVSYCMATGSFAGGAQTLDVMLENAVNDMAGPFFSLMSMLSFIIGVYYILHGLIMASKYGYDPRGNSQTRIIGSFIGGALMIALSDSIGVVMGSLFGATTITNSVVSWTMVSNLTTDATAQTAIQGAITACLTVVQMIGIIAFIRGIMILKKCTEGSGQAKMPQGITHIIGGVLALNIYQFLTIMGQTFGTDFF